MPSTPAVTMFAFKRFPAAARTSASRSTAAVSSVSLIIAGPTLGAKWSFPARSSIPRSTFSASTCVSPRVYSGNGCVEMRIPATSYPADLIASRTALRNFTVSSICIGYDFASIVMNPVTARTFGFGGLAAYTTGRATAVKMTSADRILFGNAIVSAYRQWPAQLKHQQTVKIATYNINNVNRRIDNLLAWLTRAEPDVVCLQELKAEQSAFPASAFRAIGYGSVWQGERSWNGVAILERGSGPVLTRSSLPGNSEDNQARYIEAAVNGVLIASLYLPNGNPQPGPKFDYKMAWFERLMTHAGALLAAGVPAVLAGDYNVVPAAQDIYPTRSLDNNALVQPESRQAFARLVTQGWTDALRRRHPEGPLWTFWDYKRDRWLKDKGMRLDHLLLSPETSERMIDGDVDRWVRGEENASDHAPAWVTLSL